MLPPFRNVNWQANTIVDSPKLSLGQTNDPLKIQNGSEAPIATSKHWPGIGFADNDEFLDWSFTRLIP
jgi:hypothetical protein